MTRFAILGQDHADAYRISQGPQFRDSLDSPVLIGAASMALTITGSVGGMKLTTVYVSPSAHRGANYQVAYDALRRCLAVTGGQFREIDAFGRSVLGEYELRIEAQD